MDSAIVSSNHWNQGQFRYDHTPVWVVASGITRTHWLKADSAMTRTGRAVWTPLHGSHFLLVPKCFTHPSLLTLQVNKGTFDVTQANEGLSKKTENSDRNKSQQSMGGIVALEECVVCVDGVRDGGFCVSGITVQSVKPRVWVSKLLKKNQTNQPITRTTQHISIETHNHS